MMHFFRRSKIHLDCFTSRRDVIEHAPIVNGVDVIPEWWKKLPKKILLPNEMIPRASMKTCIGMYDYYNKSVAMPLWCDLSINIFSKEDYRWQFSDLVSTGIVHGVEQYNGVLPNASFGHFKIESPWLFNTKADVNWVLSSPIYNQDRFRNYEVAQGLLNFSRQGSTNVQMFLDVSAPRNFIIPFGSVFLFTPMTDKKVVLHRQLISKEEFDSKASISRGITFINKYITQHKTIKCPYKDRTK